MAKLADYTQYRRKQIAELRPYVPSEDMRRISVSHEDDKAGSPKLGDMIARNPKNYDDRWLVAAAYFADNFEPINSRTPPASESPVRARSETVSRRPVAFRVNRQLPDVNGNAEWQLFNDEATARDEANQLDGEYQGLYVRDGVAGAPENTELQRLRHKIEFDGGVPWSDEAIARELASIDAALAPARADLEGLADAIYSTPGLYLSPADAKKVADAIIAYLASGSK